MLKKSSQCERLVLCPTKAVEDLPERIRLSDLAQGVIKPVRTSRGQVAIVFLRDGKPRAFDARCPHMGSDLRMAACVGGDIICAWHGYRYDGNTGAFVENPNEKSMKGIRVRSATFDPALKQSYRLREYELEIGAGWISVK